MSELMNKVSKDNIRTGMNLVFTMMKFLSMLLDLASDSQMARETLTATAESMFQETAILFRDISMYTGAISQAEAGFVPSYEETQ